MGLIHKVICDKCRNTIKEKSYMTIEPTLIKDEKHKTAFQKLYICRDCYEELLGGIVAE